MITKEADLDWAFSKMERIGWRLKILSISLLTTTLMNLCIVFLTMGGVIYVQSSFISLITITMAFTVFLMALVFDSLRKEGKSYYDEISGIRHAKVISSENHKSADADSIKGRIAIRNFKSSYDIPLVPGQFGPGAIVIINVLIVFLWVSLLSK